MKASDTYRVPPFRYNCAQAIAAKYASKYGISKDEAIARFATCAAGGAPGGLCGALYAAQQADPANADAAANTFAAHTGGHLTCRDLKTIAHVPCKTCIDIADQILGGDNYASLGNE